MPPPLELDLADLGDPNSGGHVVHLVGRVTEVVFGFLGPMTAALENRGIAQTVILLDDPDLRSVLPRFNPNIRLVLIPADKGRLRRFGLEFGALIAAIDRESADALHLHGIFPCLIGLCARRFALLPPALFFSPHGSKSLGPLRLFGNILIRLLRPCPGKMRKKQLQIPNQTPPHCSGLPSKRYRLSKVQLNVNF